jgi:small subunit ribosomal protein S14
MKKILSKDKKNRKILKQLELNHFILKQISSNKNFFKATRWNALYQLSSLPKESSKTILSNRCIKTVNKKTFNKITSFSRMVFLKLAKMGQISGMRKSTW